MARKNGCNRVPQRNHLRANKEVGRRKNDPVFALFRPVSQDTTDEVYARLHALQQEEDIPPSVRLFSHDMDSSLIQERRMRNAVRSFMMGVAVQTIFGRVESTLPSRGRDSITAAVTGFDIVGRNHNIIVARVADEEGKLEDQRQQVLQLMGELGVKMNVDKCAHVTVGVVEHGELTRTEQRHVKHTAFETIQDIPIELLPVTVEYQGQRTPLANAKFLSSRED